MKKFNLNDFKGGWFIGNFSPSVFQTEEFEVALKKYKKGEVDALHFHREAIELTLIIEGYADFSGTIVKENDIILIEKNEQNLFKALTDVKLCVVKFPSIPGDKYLLNE